MARTEGALPTELRGRDHAMSATERLIELRDEDGRRFRAPFTWGSGTLVTTVITVIAGVLVPLLILLLAYEWI